MGKIKEEIENSRVIKSQLHFLFYNSELHKIKVFLSIK